VSTVIHVQHTTLLEKNIRFFLAYHPWLSSLVPAIHAPIHIHNEAKILSDLGGSKRAVCFHSHFSLNSVTSTLLQQRGTLKKPVEMHDDFE
jgi:hypothetical protein